MIYWFLIITDTCIFFQTEGSLFVIAFASFLAVMVTYYAAKTIDEFLDDFQADGHLFRIFRNLSLIIISFVILFLSITYIFFPLSFITPVFYLGVLLILTTTTGLFLWTPLFVAILEEIFPESKYMQSFNSICELEQEEVSITNFELGLILCYLFFASTAMVLELDDFYEVTIGIFLPAYYVATKYGFPTTYKLNFVIVSFLFGSHLLAPSHLTNRMNIVFQFQFLIGLLTTMSVGFGITRNKILKKAEKMTREELMHIQRMETIGELSGGVAHDFNNFLQVLLGNLQILEMTEEFDDKLKRQIISEMYQVTDNMSILTSQLITMSRRNVTSSTNVNLNELFRKNENLLSRMIGDNFNITYLLLPDLPDIYGDVAHLEQVILNLILNAKGAMENGGNIIISTSLEVIKIRKELLFGGIGPGEYVKLSITDHGIGIPDSEFKNIFQPFYTTNSSKGGVGLGLSMVQSIINQHEGKLHVISKIAVGTTFELYFKVYTTQKGGSIILPTQKKKIIQNVIPKLSNVVIVDDEPEITKNLKILLGCHEFQITTYSDADDLLQDIENDQIQFDFLITDVLMPKLNGIEMAQKIREINGIVPVLLISGYTKEHYDKTNLDIDRFAFLEKPFKEKDLIVAMNEAIDLCLSFQDVSNEK